MEIYPVLDIIRRNFTPVDTYSFTWIYDFPYLKLKMEKYNPLIILSHHQKILRILLKILIMQQLYIMIWFLMDRIGFRITRTNSPDIQRKVLEMWGLSDDDIENRFGWFIEALSYGTPQHAGIALGIDRIIAVMLNVDSIRDVIPFLKHNLDLTL